MNIIEPLVDAIIDIFTLLFKIKKHNTDATDDLFRKIGLKNSEGEYPKELSKPYLGEDGYKEFYFSTPVGVELSHFKSKTESIAGFFHVDEYLVEIDKIDNNPRKIVIRIEV